MKTSAEALPDEVDALKALVVRARAELIESEALVAITQAEVTEAYALIDELKLRIAKARQDKWGQSSERHKHLVDQLEMQLEDVAKGLEGVAVDHAGGIEVRRCGSVVVPDLNVGRDQVMDLGEF
jgi:uncharacterized protein YukE